VAEESQTRRRGRPPAGAREAILTAAWDLISEAGLVTLTTREVARRAGVSEASVFYHFGDKAGLLEQVVLTGLAPLKAPGPGPGGEPLVGTLGRLAAALEAFFDHAMPVLAAVQSDASLRRSFVRRLVDGDLGPHRGVQMLSEQLTVLSADGLADPGVDPGAASLLLIGACFLRSWERQMTGAERAATLPALTDVVHTLAQLLTPGRT
jgi:AcrR family transcriptional regulator